jgi:flagellar biosynthetic protein FlhB
VILEYNLQFFAPDGPGGEKTEPATAKKLSDARKEGQVAKSKELGNAVVLISFFLFLKIGISYIGSRLLESIEYFINKIPEVVVIWNGNIESKVFADLITEGILKVILTALPLYLAALVIALVIEIIQVGWQISGKPLQPKLSKISPLKGFKRIFSMNSLVELLKSLLKVGTIAYVVYSTLQDQWGLLLRLYETSFYEAIAIVGTVTIDLGLRVAIIYLIIALADYIYQRWKFARDMRMTKKEVKDEMKSSEGDPQIKGQIRARMREASRRRMMQDLPTADVVITNPTHYAVALKYDADISDAPFVIAKGQDHLAQRIKEIAKEHDIEIVENKPLARSLYANCEVGGVIPNELYQAVADVLAFVYKIKGKI